MFDTAGLRSAPFRRGLLRYRQRAQPGGEQAGPGPELPQPDLDFSIAVVNGTSMMPWLSSALIHTPIRSIETGSAEATPTAVPRSLAMVSSLASARSISAAVGTASMERSALANG